MSYVGKNFIAPVMLYVKSDFMLDANITAYGGDILHRDTATGYLKLSDVGASGNYLLIKDASTGAGEHIYVDVLILGVGNVKVDSAEVNTIYAGTPVFVKDNRVTATPTTGGDYPYGIAVSDGSAGGWIGVAIGMTTSKIQ